MNAVSSTTSAHSEQIGAMQRYYRVQAKIYDATRWSFLFGRKQLVSLLPLRRLERAHLLEVGCGTGYNLKKIEQRYPNLTLTGLDASADMIEAASKKFQNKLSPVDLRAVPYQNGHNLSLENLKIVMFSYSLTMINPQWSELIDQAYEDLPKGGYIAVVDFHNSPLSLFKRWMGYNHVRMDGHLVDYLNHKFNTRVLEINNAYMGCWKYFLYIGEK